MSTFWRVFTLCLIVLLCAALLAGCGSKRSWRTGGVPGSKPYTIRGKTYYPLKSARGFVEIGVASWYGPGFHGKKTANGERYNQYGLSAAHKILPLGTKVKVTNLANRRSIILRINDRGPFVDDRVIDLSRGAATKLGIIAKGTGRVKIQSLDMAGSDDDETAVRETLATVAPAVVAVTPAIVRGVSQLSTATPPPQREPAYTPPPPARGQGPFYIQVGSFTSKDNARTLAQRLMYGGHRGRLHYGSERRWNVQVGPLQSAGDVDVILRLLRQQYPQAFVVAP